MISKSLTIACVALLTLALGMTAAAQSTDANFPTNVITSEIVGTIPARDIGDSRETSYYYTFDGGQGDMFINVVTRNFVTGSGVQNFDTGSTPSAAEGAIFNMIGCTGSCTIPNTAGPYSNVQY